MLGNVNSQQAQPDTGAVSAAALSGALYVPASTLTEEAVRVTGRNYRRTGERRY